LLPSGQSALVNNVYLGTTGAGTLQLTGGGLVCYGIFFGSDGGALNLNAGTIFTPQLDLGTNGALNLNGGILAANASSANFVTSGGTNGVNIRAAGGVVQPNGFFLIMTAPVTGGALTNLGPGELTLDSANLSEVCSDAGVLFLGYTTNRVWVAGPAASSRAGALATNGGFVINQAPGIIYGGSGANGSEIGDYPPTPGGPGVELGSGGALQNLGSVNGALGGGGDFFYGGGTGGPGVSMHSATSRVYNQGTINGGNGSQWSPGGAGVYSDSGGAVTNIAPGSIAGGGGASDGFDAGNGGDGVHFDGGGTVVNASVISGGPGASSFLGNSPYGYGVGVAGGVGVVVNQGTINNGVSLDNSYANQVTFYPGSIIKSGLNMGTNASSQIILDGTGTANFSSAISGALTWKGLLLKQGAGAWNVDTALHNPGPDTIAAGALVVVDGGTLGSAAVVDNSTLEFNCAGTKTFSNSVSGSGALQNLGSGAVTITSACTYSGGTTEDGGTLALSGPTASIYHPGADLNVGSTSNGTLIVTNGAIITDANGFLGGSPTASGSAVVAGAGSVWSNTQNLDVGVFGPGSVTAETGGTLAVKGGAGTIALGVAESYGSLQIGNGNAPGIVNAATITVGGGAGALIFNHTSTSYYLTTNGTAAGAAINLSGPLTVTHNAGYTALTGADTYNGPTFVNGGTLAIDGQFTGGSAMVVASNATLAINGTLNGSGPVTITTGGILAGSGTVSQPVSFQAGSELSPGGPGGVLHVTSQTLSSSVIYAWTFTNAAVAGGWGQLAVSGNLTINASPASPITVAVKSFNGFTPGLAAGFDGTRPGAWTLATYSGSLSGFSSNNFVFDTTHLVNPIYSGFFHISAATAGQLQLIYTPPATPVVVGASPSFIGPRAAQIQVAVNPEGIASVVYVQMGTNTSYGLTSLAQNVALGSTIVTNTCTVTGFKPGATIHYRAVLTSAAGTVYGSDQTFVASPDRSIFGNVVSNDLVVATSTNSPAGQTADYAIDGLVGTKYVNLDITNTGFTVYPSGNRIVTELSLISADDHPEGDPASFVLSGSSDGTNFVVIASNSVPLFPARNSLQTFSFTNTVAYNAYRLIFPTVQDPATANSMQIAEVELLPYADLTTPATSLSLALPAAATLASSDAPGALLDRQLAQPSNNLIVLNDSDIVTATITPMPSILKGFEIIGGYQDLSHPGSTPPTITLEATSDGVDYDILGVFTPAAPASNLEIQQFALLTNMTVYTRYQLLLGRPSSGAVLEMGELRLWGIGLPPTLTCTAAGVSSIRLAWPDSGATLQACADLTARNWVAVTNAPVTSNGTNTLILNMQGSSQFFRLIR
jgi:T5SS/PEP-CTERM-associated repeat protein/autotransporter-associated beta strand protein